MEAVVPPPTSGTQIPDPAPLSLMPPTLAEPAVTLPTRALPLQSWNSALRASQPIAEATRCGGYLANVSVMKLEAWYLTLQPVQVLAAVAPRAPEYVPAPQSVQAPEPVLVLNLPAAHAQQVLPPEIFHLGFKNKNEGTRPRALKFREDRVQDRV